MQFEEYEILTIIPEIKDIFIIRLKPKGKRKIPKFTPGQFYHIKNPTYEKPRETRQFSIITTPKTKDYLEFCIKIYGPWTQALFEKKKGDTVWLFGPMGVFTHQQKTTHAVFIAGGVGITPILSIIQSLHEKKSTTPVTLIYANKSSQTIVKKTHIENLFQANPSWKHIFLVSQEDSLSTKERHGHITDELLKEEVKRKDIPVFYVCGSKRFTENITSLLQRLDIPDTHIKKEVFLPLYPRKTAEND